jgi:hypothetical protein
MRQPSVLSTARAVYPHSSRFYSRWAIAQVTSAGAYIGSTAALIDRPKRQNRDRTNMDAGSVGRALLLEAAERVDIGSSFEICSVFIR